MAQPDTINKPQSPSPKAPQASEAPGLALPALLPGLCAMVVEIEAPGDDIARLMAMGVCVGRKVELVKAGDPLILRVLGSRIGVSARLAQRVRVDPCIAPECQPQV